MTIAEQLHLPGGVQTRRVVHSSKNVAYNTDLGTMLHGSSEDLLKAPGFTERFGRAQLIFTSPPFPLNRKKKYGNLQGEDYVKWLAALAPVFKDLLTPDGSIVMELGNSWEPGEPVMSILAMKSLLSFLETGALKLCQQFVVHNPARLPSPAEWVTVKRVRVKDAFTHVWWMSPTATPKADNRKVLVEYSPAMKKLLARKSYNAGKRPSEHHIGKESFLKENGGAIPSNVLTVSNTGSSEPYLGFCEANNLELHPARMPAALPEFFINLLTDENDLVLDPFGGSNTTGATAERLKRRWVSVEMKRDYVLGSLGRFPGANVSDEFLNEQPAVA